mmetsp:Transcript_5471/g.4163  ORF Transcript_5471/g.4163 Transcript_5471/m.4163 type:complete len:305 (+) Transcript_5471:1324-2238(+)|eukprot:CAMPEP_0202965198 /NCGR_PEP_ID=MMETSP1396-20130829/9257_1 /ASSEMBLY_ACC=CAM_ASM_000872 /TAXON_ID= /ORGANISM="Pseudokeronopsis sp., Strain Brazil" /LENGTH=304 /DNA_ID=CAMNT_0049687843 /DNA_START=1315 /DNA_END=2229 /DNA_ORIENTATION=-
MEKTFSFKSMEGFNCIIKPKGDEYLYLVYDGCLDVLDYKVFNKVMEIRDDRIENVIAGYVYSSQAIVLSLFSSEILIIMNYFGNPSFHQITTKNYAQKLIPIRYQWDTNNSTSHLLVCMDYGSIGVLDVASASFIKEFQLKNRVSIYDVIQLEVQALGNEFAFGTKSGVLQGFIDKRKEQFIESQTEVFLTNYQVESLHLLKNQRFLAYVRENSKMTLEEIILVDRRTGSTKSLYSSIYKELSSKKTQLIAVFNYDRFAYVLMRNMNSLDLIDIKRQKVITVLKGYDTTDDWKFALHNELDPET